MVVPYAISYSRRVREAFAALIRATSDPEEVKRILAAGRTLDHRLQIYPQFGEPLRDLSIANTSLWIGVESPLVIKYIIDENSRQVLAGFPFRLVRKPADPRD